MKNRINHSKLRDLPFGARIKVVWRKEKDEYVGTIFGDKIGYTDGLVDSIRTICEAEYNGLCDVYLYTKNANPMWDELIDEIEKYYMEVCKYGGLSIKYIYRKDAVHYIQNLIAKVSNKYGYMKRKV